MIVVVMLRRVIVCAVALDGCVGFALRSCTCWFTCEAHFMDNVTNVADDVDVDDGDDHQQHPVAVFLHSLTWPLLPLDSS